MSRRIRKRLAVGLAARGGEIVKSRIGLLALLASLVLALVALTPAGAAPATGHRYSLVAAYTFSGTPGGTDFSANHAGTLGCIENCAEVPGSATFSLQLGATTRAQPGDPCRLKRGFGQASIAWSDATSSTGSVNARARDRKVYVFDGTVSSGRFAGYALKGWVSIPTDPCQPESVTGELSFLPPDPI